MEKLNGIVKQVISADTYILIGAKRDGVAQEKQISLACVQCPRLFMKSQNYEKAEEPFAWEGREFIRKLIIGKNVNFVIEYIYNNRTYCSVFFEGENLAVLLLKRGYANLIVNKNIKTNVHTELEEYNKEAKEKKIGIFGNNVNHFIRNIIYSYNDKHENKKIFELFANKKVKCVIEHVRDGSNFRVFAEDPNEKKETEEEDEEGAEYDEEEEGENKTGTKGEKKEHTEGDKDKVKKKKNRKKKRRSIDRMGTDIEEKEEKYKTMYYFSFSLCGVIVDMFKKEIVNDVETVKEELYAHETKKFVEARLLNRDVEIEIKHIDNNSNLYANIHYKLGNICILLLKNGYAYINDYTIKYVDNPMEYRASLEEAINLRKKKWINYTEKEIDYEKEYFSTIIEVLYGDVIIVDYKNEERRLYLASIKCEKQNTDLKLNTLCILAKDLLKNEIIGERVKIVTEYVKTPQTNSEGYIPQCSDDKGRMHFVSVYKIESPKKKGETSVERANSLSNKWGEKKGKKKSHKKKGKGEQHKEDATDNINNSKEKEEDEEEHHDNKKNASPNHKVTEENNEERYINMNELLVSKGLAKVINHRQDDERASNYFVLQELEKEAEQKKLGRFSTHLDIIKINNISGSENSIRARSFENTLNKYNNLNAHVDYIYGANKFKLHIPSQNLIINFLLLGITIQRINVKDVASAEVKKKKEDSALLNGEIKQEKKEKDEYKEFAILAYKYTRRQLMQRCVQITIVTCDKGGNFIGILKHHNVDYAVHLLSLGYGFLNEIGLSNTSERASYVKAAEEAKNQKKNIWSIEKSEYAEDLLKAEADLAVYDNIYYCSFLDDVQNIYIQLKSKQEELKKLQDELNKSGNVELLKPVEAKKNALVLAKYVDKLWYRAVILQVFKNKKKIVVKYVDFGNEEELDFTDIRKLNDEYNIKKIPPFAIRSGLAGLKIPKENKPELIVDIRNLLVDKFLYVKFEKKVSSLFHVVYYDYEKFTTNKNVKSVNEEIALKGFCYVDITSDTKIFDKLKKEEDQAKKNKVAIWSYGDIDYDDEIEE